LVELNDSVITHKFCRMVKHLQNIPIPYSLFDNPYNVEYTTAVAELLHYAQSPDIDQMINIEQLSDQQYLNYLHEIYERGYNGKNDWLMWHEAIHAIELANNQKQYSASYKIAYRANAGPLQLQFTKEEQQQLTPDVGPGDCYFGFSELGKTPYLYWKDGEPADIHRIIELAKPAITFRPLLRIEVSESGYPRIPPNIDQFNTWFAPYKTAWCQHWGLTDWTAEQMFGVLKIGQVIDFDHFDTLIKNKDYVCKIDLKN